MTKMVYNNSSVRRQDRLLSEESAAKLLSDGEYGVLSMSDGGEGYGVPVSYVWDGASAVYIHCAPEGRKMRCMTDAPLVSLCVVGRTKVLPDKFTTEYESVVVSCEAHTELSEEERQRAVRLLLEKFSPDDVETGLKYASRSMGRTAIVRLDIISVSGKSKPGGR